MVTRGILLANSVNEVKKSSLYLHLHQKFRTYFPWFATNSDLPWSYVVTAFPHTKSIIGSFLKPGWISYGRFSSLILSYFDP